jgi:CRISPR-associated protein Cmr4
MVNYTGHAYLIECLSNLHVGSSGDNYGVIDKQVQRDPITGLPVIHASGLKGALREYFTICTPLADAKDKLTEIFGSDKGEKDKEQKDKMQQGAYRFFEANLLSLPVRATDNGIFYRATSTGIVNAFNDTRQSFAKQGCTALSIMAGTGQPAQTEFGNAPLSDGSAVLGELLLPLKDDEMKEACKNLPIIARNSLDNGQSENLWYEEVVPRYSRFYFFVSVPDDNDTLSFMADFNKHIDGHSVQIGANATVGYGHCKITKIN